jgi:hypothetical protein
VTAGPFWYLWTMTQSPETRPVRSSGAPVSTSRPDHLAEPLPPGGRSDVVPPPAEGALPAVVGAPPVTSAVPVPGVPVGHQIPGVQLSQRPRRPGDRFGWPSNAAPGKPEGEVDTRS